MESYLSTTKSPQWKRMVTAAARRQGLIALSDRFRLRPERNTWPKTVI